MQLIKLIKAGSNVSRRRLLAMAATAGVANAAALGTINTAAEGAGSINFDGSIPWKGALGLLAAIAAYVMTQRYVMRICADEVETIVCRLRVSMMERVAAADLVALESIGIGELYAAISAETLTISQAANTLIVGFQAAFVAAFVLIYVGFLSLPALLLSVCLVIFAARLHLRRLAPLGARFVETMQADSTLFEALDDAIAGAKEIRLDSALCSAIQTEVSEHSLAVMQARSKLQDDVGREFVFMQALFFILLAAIVFIVPNYAPHHPDITTKVATSMLFVAGSLSLLLQAAPSYSRAEVAAIRIDALGTRLLAAGAPDEDEAEPTVRTFSTIRLDEVRFAYLDTAGEQGFTVGPISLEVQRGEILFIIGGNGSGKSTLLKLLTGLYRPLLGQVLLDGQPIEPRQRTSYRGLFSIILSDFHLFERLYGVPLDARAWQRELERFGLTGKTSLQEDRFVTVQLSTGQRKRLAMLVARAENRPVLVLDEWAAEQDPVFRKFFYETLLPELREMGVTVIATTHDDRYLSVADRVLRMDMGMLELLPHVRKIGV